MAPNIDPNPISMAIVWSVFPTPSAKVFVIIENGMPDTKPIINAEDMIAINGCILNLMIKNNKIANPNNAPMISLSGEASKLYMLLPPVSIHQHVPHLSDIFRI